MGLIPGSPVTPAPARRRRRDVWAGAAVALGGVAILAGPEALSLRSGSAELAGAALVLLGTLLFGGYTLVLRPLSRAYGALPATAASTVAGSLPYAAFAGLVSPRQFAALPAAAWGELAILAFGSTAAGLLLWNLAVSRLPGSRVSLLLYLEPLVSVVGAVSLLHEHISGAMIIGGVLVLAGVGATWVPRPDRPHRAVRGRGGLLRCGPRCASLRGLGLAAAVIGP